MLFGKKAEEPKPATKQEYEEDDDLDMEEDDNLYNKIDGKKPTAKEAPVPAPETKAQPISEKEAMIVSGAVIQDGIYEFVIRSNYSIGEVGSRV
jgi:hypothetical protein